MYIEMIYNIGNKTVCISYVIIAMVLLEFQAAKLNSQREHGQPVVQTRSLFCTCDSSVRVVNHGTNVSYGE